MKYRIIEVEGGYEIETKVLFFWINMNRGGFVERIPYTSALEAEHIIKLMTRKSKYKRVVKEINA